MPVSAGLPGRPGPYLQADRAGVLRAGAAVASQFEGTALVVSIVERERRYISQYVQ